MVNSLKDVEKSIIDVRTEIESLDNQLLELNYKVFERVQTEFENLNSEMENLAGLFDDFNDIKVSDGNGNWTNEAIATIGLYAQQYELARYQVSQYSDAIEKLNKEYLDGKYSATEYMDKLAELSQGQWDAVNSAESLEDAIIDLNETRIDEEIETIQDEIDAYKKLTDAQIESLEASEDLRKEKETLAEKSKAVADIERQLIARQNDDTASTVAKRKKLEEELAEAKKDLADTEHDYSIEAQKDALNKQYEDFENSRNEEIEALKLSLENREALIAQSLETVKTNASIVGEQISLIAQEHGIIVSNAVITPWQNGETAIASYGTVLSSQSSAFITTLMGVESQVYNLQTQADIASQSISAMFSNRADTLVGELVSSYNSEDNLNAMTNTLQNSLVNTLERGYNVSSITSALSSIASGADSVASAAQRAAQALSEMGAAQSDTPTYYPNGRYGIINGYNGKIVESGLSEADARKILNSKYGGNAGSYHIKAFAKGGLITKDDDGSFDPIAKSLGEDTMIAVQHGESILTPIQTENMLKLAELLKNPYNMGNSYNMAYKPSATQNLPEIKIKERPNITLHYDKMFEFNGDFNNSEQLLKKMESVSNKVTTNILNDINNRFRR